MRETMRAAVVQMNSTPDVEANLASAARAVQRAAEHSAALVVLPECYALLGPEPEKLTIAEALPRGGPILDHARALAARWNVELILGGFWERSASPGRVYNACVHLRANGDVSAVYRKMHLFDVDLPDGTQLRESGTVLAGEAPIWSNSVVGRLGLSICYDLRFPELYGHLVRAGAEVLVVPAAFTQTTGKDHWHTLLRARAVENQCYVLAAAQVGHHFGQRRSYGHALIADPWGEVLAECVLDAGTEGECTSESVAVADIDLAYLKKVRRELPSVAHRRHLPDARSGPSSL